MNGAPKEGSGADLLALSIIINNNGYTIERSIHGARQRKCFYLTSQHNTSFSKSPRGKQSQTCPWIRDSQREPAYNNILPIQYSYLPHLFSHPHPTTAHRRAATKTDLEAALADPNLSEPKEVQILEVVMDQLDIPWRLAQYLKRKQEGYMRLERFTNVD